MGSEMVGRRTPDDHHGKKAAARADVDLDGFGAATEKLCRDYLLILKEEE
jgi:hypothetical protein